jgi:hypothetical protein
MAAITAELQFGVSHQNDGGLRVKNRMFLSEGDRPAWKLTWRPRETGVPQNAIWIPTIESMLDDALFMASCLLFEDPAVLELLRRHNLDDPLKSLEMYKFNKSDRATFYNACANSIKFSKVVAVIYRGSSLLNNINEIKKYQMDYEVCCPSFGRELAPISTGHLGLTERA